MSRAYNPVYKGMTDAKISAIYDNIEADRVFRSISWGADVDLTNEETDRVHDFVICAEANDEPAELTRRASPLIYERLNCPPECPVTYGAASPLGLAAMMGKDEPKEGYNLDRPLYNENSKNGYPF